MQEHYLENLIGKYLDGSISNLETEKLKELLKEPKHKKNFEEITQCDFEMELALHNTDSEASYQKLQEIINRKAVVRHRKSRTLLLRYAAFFGGLLVLGLFAALYVLKQDGPLPINEITLQLQDGSYQVIDLDKTSEITNTSGQTVVLQEQNRLYYGQDSSRAVANGVDDLAYNELKVPYGKKIQVSLSDGTLIHLNSGSIFKYPVRFSSQGEREVFLDGEAFFEVVTNKEQPFVVVTKEMNTTALGTKFNVSSYANEQKTHTVLVEGSVRVDGNSLSRLVEPGEQALLENGTLAVKEVSVAKHIAWTKGQLYFENDRFAQIIKELERHFNVSIQCRFERLNRTFFTGTFENVTLNNILASFQLHSDFEFETIENDKGETVIKIKPKN